LRRGRGDPDGRHRSGSLGGDRWRCGGGLSASQRWHYKSWSRHRCLGRRRRGRRRWSHCSERGNPHGRRRDWRRGRLDREPGVRCRYRPSEQLQLEGRRHGRHLGGAIGSGIGKLGGVFANAGFVGGAARGLAGSALSQGIGVATGLQDKFDWAGIAAAGIGGGVGSQFGKWFGAGSLADSSPRNIIANLSATTICSQLALLR
jgi:hypothetical protein